MDLPTIGAHCSLETCNVNDFLPIRCRCDRLFCKDHISLESHSCSFAHASDNRARLVETDRKLQRCAAEKCSKPSLEGFIADRSNSEGRTPAVCPRCRQSFCATHREPESHGCTAPDPAQSVTPRNEAGRAILAKMFPQSSTSHNGVLPPTIPPKRKAIPSANPKKAAQLRQVELMKMRHRAQPGDPRDKDKHVAVDQKLHLKVYIEEHEGDERFFWFRKTMGTGKALDLLALQMGISCDTVPLYLVKVPISGSEDRVTLQNDKLLVEQVEDGMQVALSR